MTLSRAAALLIVLIAFSCVPRARADETLDLTWNDCPAGPTALSNLIFDCAADTGSSNLVVAFSVAAPVDSVIGIEAVVDLQIAAVTLPAWWQFAQGGCRAGSLDAREDFTHDTACQDPWHDAGGALVQDYQPGQPRGGASQARIRAVVSIPSSALVHLDAGPVYYGVRLVIGHDRTSTCVGCTAPGCLVLNSLWIRRVPGAIGGDLLLVTPGTNQARWQNDSPTDCAAVPVRRSTWGQLRTMYRP